MPLSTGLKIGELIRSKHHKIGNYALKTALAQGVDYNVIMLNPISHAIDWQKTSETQMFWSILHQGTIVDPEELRDFYNIYPKWRPPTLEEIKNDIDRGLKLLEQKQKTRILNIVEALKNHKSE